MSRYIRVLRQLIILLVSGLYCSVCSLFKFLFGTKSILFISKNNIKNFSLGGISQGCLLIFMYWFFDITLQSIKHDSIVRSKDKEIQNLRIANSRFEKEVVLLNQNFKKMNEYFISVSRYNNLSYSDKYQDLTPDNFNRIFGDISLNEQDRKIALTISSSNAILDNIKNIARNRILDLEKKISITGIRLKNSLSGNLSNYNPSYNAKTIYEISLNDSPQISFGQGGPFSKPESTKQHSHLNQSSEINGVNIHDEITHLSELEKFLQYAPLSKPMKNYYVSSGFGARMDPINHHDAVHNGMDFVGPINENVISPSTGRVTFAGKLGAYGKIVIIDHGYGITTRYGHLSKIKVVKDAIVKSGEVIGVQGNTGRSTGSHLHYEIRYNNRPLNPKNFLKAGKVIF